VAVKIFLYVGANVFTPHIAAPIYLLCVCNKIGENTRVTCPWKCNEFIFFTGRKTGLDYDRWANGKWTSTVSPLLATSRTTPRKQSSGNRTTQSGARQPSPGSHKQLRPPLTTNCWWTTTLVDLRSMKWPTTCS